MRYSGLIEANLKRLWEMATEEKRSAGINWYRNANAECTLVAAELQIPATSFIGIVAALSPGLRWDRNISEAARLVQALKAGSGEIPAVGVYGRRNQEKAAAIFHGAEPLAVLGGFKVRAFYSNITAPDRNTSITVDRHAYCAAVNRRNRRDFHYTQLQRTAGKETKYKVPPIDKPRWYNHIARHYRALADKLGVLAHELQAVIWLVWRRIVGAAETSEA